MQHWWGEAPERPKEFCRGEWCCKRSSSQPLTTAEPYVPNPWRSRHNTTFHGGMSWAWLGERSGLISIVAGERLVP